MKLVIEVRDRHGQTPLFFAPSPETCVEPLAQMCQGLLCKILHTEAIACFQRVGLCEPLAARDYCRRHGHRPPPM